jgi:hypothetical protein
VPNGDHLSFIGFPPEYPSVARFVVDAGGRLVFVKDDARFVLGPRAGTLPPGTLPPGTMPDGTPLQGHEPIPAYAPEPGDTMSAALDRSLLSWPTPLFQVNFMTGYVPSWQRNLYYRFAWTNASGARLAILWRQRAGLRSHQRLDRRAAHRADPHRDPAGLRSADRMGGAGAMSAFEIPTVETAWRRLRAFYLVTGGTP